MSIQPPFMVSYSITTKCNLKCKHCYSESVDEPAPDELSTEEAFHLIDDLSKWGIGLLVIDGGEPLCREDMLDVVKYASSKGIRTTVGSNGTLIDEAMARKMLDAGVKCVAISVDGVDAQTHDSFRGLTGTFEQTLKGVEACRNAGLPFQFNTVIRKETLSQLQDLLRLGVDYGANAAELFDLVAAGSQATLSDFLDTVDYMVKLIGIDHVGIGCDFTKGQSQEWFRWLFTGRNTDKVPRFQIDWPVTYPKGLQGAADFPNLTRALLQRGYSKTDVKKIMGENFLRLFREVWS